MKRLFIVGLLATLCGCATIPTQTVVVQESSQWDSSHVVYVQQPYYDSALVLPVFIGGAIVGSRYHAHYGYRSSYHGHRH